jgi:hypothetical protein
MGAANDPFAFVERGGDGPDEEDALPGWRRLRALAIGVGATRAGNGYAWGVSSVSDGVVLRLLWHAEALEDLDVTGCWNASLHGFERALYRWWPPLRSLRAARTKLASDEAIENVLCVERVSRFADTNKKFPVFRRLSSTLETLELGSPLSHAKRVTDDGLRNLQKFDTLRELGLAGADVTDAGVRRLLEGGPPNRPVGGTLRAIDVSACRGLSRAVRSAATASGARPLEILAAIRRGEKEKEKEKEGGV